MCRSVRLDLITFALVVVCSTLGIGSANATIWNVYENGSGDAPTIQAAFDSTANGDTIAIHCGDYTGPDLTIFVDSRNVRFIGQGGDPSCVRIRFNVAMYSDVTFFENLTFAFGSSVIIDFDEDPQEGALGDFQNCVFDSSNVGMAAGGQFTDCVFQSGVRNEGGSVGGYYHGGATFDHCLFRDNHAGSDGGAVYAWLYSMYFADCRFENNSSNDRGGAVYSETSAILTFERCEFVGNVAGTDGGAVSARRGRVRLFDSLLEDNVAGRMGGAVAIDTSQGSNVFSVLWNCTLWGNEADSLGGSVYYDGNGSITGGFAILNTIISGTVQGEAVHVADLAPKVFCTDIWGNPGGDWTGPLADSLAVNNNFSLNPKFCDAGAGNFDLKPSSPCLDVVGCTYGTLVGFSGAECASQATDVAGASGDAETGAEFLIATPNPFRGDVTLRFAAPATGAAEFVVFDLRGREVVRTPVPTGARSATWDGRDERGRAVSPGVYFLQVSNGTQSQTAKITLLR